MSSEPPSTIELILALPVLLKVQYSPSLSNVSFEDFNELYNLNRNSSSSNDNINNNNKSSSNFGNRVEGASSASIVVAREGHSWQKNSKRKKKKYAQLETLQRNYFDVIRGFIQCLHTREEERFIEYNICDSNGGSSGNNYTLNNHMNSDLTKMKQCCGRQAYQLLKQRRRKEILDCFFTPRKSYTQVSPRQDYQRLWSQAVSVLRHHGAGVYAALLESIGETLHASVAVTTSNKKKSNEEEEEMSTVDKLLYLILRTSVLANIKIPETQTLDWVGAKGGKGTDSSNNEEEEEENYISDGAEISVETTNTTEAEANSAKKQRKRARKESPSNAFHWQQKVFNQDHLDEVKFETDTSKNSNHWVSEATQDLHQNLFSSSTSKTVLEHYQHPSKNLPVISNYVYSQPHRPLTLAPRLWTSHITQRIAEHSAEVQRMLLWSCEPEPVVQSLFASSASSPSPLARLGGELLLTAGSDIHYNNNSYPNREGHNFFLPSSNEMSLYEYFQRDYHFAHGEKNSDRDGMSPEKRSLGISEDVQTLFLSNSRKRNSSARSAAESLAERLPHLLQESSDATINGDNNTNNNNNIGIQNGERPSLPPETIFQSVYSQEVCKALYIALHWSVAGMADPHRLTYCVHSVSTGGGNETVEEEEVHMVVNPDLGFCNISEDKNKKEEIDPCMESNQKRSKMEKVNDNAENNSKDTGLRPLPHRGVVSMLQWSCRVGTLMLRLHKLAVSTLGGDLQYPYYRPTQESRQPAQERPPQRWAQGQYAAAAAEALLHCLHLLRRQIFELADRPGGPHNVTFNNVLKAQRRLQRTALQLQTLASVFKVNDTPQWRCRVARRELSSATILTELYQYLVERQHTSVVLENLIQDKGILYSFQQKMGIDKEKKKYIEESDHDDDEEDEYEDGTVFNNEELFSQRYLEKQEKRLSRRKDKLCNAVDAVSIIFKYTLVPLNQMIRQWITRGELCDPQDEFFIIPAAPPGYNNEEDEVDVDERGRSISPAGNNIKKPRKRRVTWSGYTTDLSPFRLPCFITPQAAEDILHAGVSVRVLRAAATQVIKATNRLQGAAHFAETEDVDDPNNQIREDIQSMNLLVKDYVHSLVGIQPDFAHPLPNVSFYDTRGQLVYWKSFYTACNTVLLSALQEEIEEQIREQEAKEREEEEKRKQKQLQLPQEQEQENKENEKQEESNVHETGNDAIQALKASDTSVPSHVDPSIGEIEIEKVVNEREEQEKGEGDETLVVIDLDEKAQSMARDDNENNNVHNESRRSRGRHHVEDGNSNNSSASHITIELASISDHGEYSNSNSLQHTRRSGGSPADSQSPRSMDLMPELDLGDSQSSVLGLQNYYNSFSPSGSSVASSRRSSVVTSALYGVISQELRQLVKPAQEREMQFQQTQSELKSTFEEETLRRKREWRLVQWREERMSYRLRRTVAMQSCVEELREVYHLNDPLRKEVVEEGKEKEEEVNERIVIPITELPPPVVPSEPLYPTIVPRGKPGGRPAVMFADNIETEVLPNSASTTVAAVWSADRKTKGTALSSLSVTRGTERRIGTNAPTATSATATASIVPLSLSMEALQAPVDTITNTASTAAVNSEDFVQNDESSNASKQVLDLVSSSTARVHSWLDGSKLRYSPLLPLTAATGTSTPSFSASWRRKFSSTNVSKSEAGDTIRANKEAAEEQQACRFDAEGYAHPDSIYTVADINDDEYHEARVGAKRWHIDIHNEMEKALLSLQDQREQFAMYNVDDPVYQRHCVLAAEGELQTMYRNKNREEDQNEKKERVEIASYTFNTSSRQGACTTSPVPEYLSIPAMLPYQQNAWPLEDPRDFENIFVKDAEQLRFNNAYQGSHNNASVYMLEPSEQYTTDSKNRKGRRTQENLSHYEILTDANVLLDLSEQTRREMDALQGCSRYYQALGQYTARYTTHKALQLTLLPPYGTSYILFKGLREVCLLQKSSIASKVGDIWHSYIHFMLDRSTFADHTANKNTSSHPHGEHSIIGGLGGPLKAVLTRKRASSNEGSTLQNEENGGNASANVTTNNSTFVEVDGHHEIQAITENTLASLNLLFEAEWHLISQNNITMKWVLVDEEEEDDEAINNNTNNNNAVLPLDFIKRIELVSPELEENIRRQKKGMWLLPQDFLSRYGQLFKILLFWKTVERTVARLWQTGRECGVAQAFIFSHTVRQILLNILQQSFWTQLTAFCSEYERSLRFESGTLYQYSSLESFAAAHDRFIQECFFVAFLTDPIADEEYEEEEEIITNDSEKKNDQKKIKVNFSHHLMQIQMLLFRLLKYVEVVEECVRLANRTLRVWEQKQKQKKAEKCNNNHNENNNNNNNEDETETDQEMKNMRHQKKDQLRRKIRDVVTQHLQFVVNDTEELVKHLDNMAEGIYHRVHFNDKETNNNNNNNNNNDTARWMQRSSYVQSISTLLKDVTKSLQNV